MPGARPWCLSVGRVLVSGRLELRIGNGREADCDVGSNLYLHDSRSFFALVAAFKVVALAARQYSGQRSSSDRGS